MRLHVASDSIEERVWETLRLKKSLATGVFDSPAAEVSFAALGKKSVLQAVKEVFADQPGRPKAVIETPPPAPLSAGARPALAKAGIGTGKASPTPAARADTRQRSGFQDAAAGLIDAGVRFLESLASQLGAGVSSQRPDVTVGRLISPLIQTDPRTNRPVLAIPLPDSVGQERLVAALSGLLAGAVRGRRE